MIGQPSQGFNFSFDVTVFFPKLPILLSISTLSSILPTEFTDNNNLRKVSRRNKLEETGGVVTLTEEEAKNRGARTNQKFVYDLNTLCPNSESEIAKPGVTTAHDSPTQEGANVDTPTGDGAVLTADATHADGTQIVDGSPYQGKTDNKWEQNNGAATDDELMIAAVRAHESGSQYTGMVAGVVLSLAENINAANVTRSGETVSGDMMRADVQVESALSEAASHCSGTAVGPAPTIVDNVHAENVPQESESTVGPVLKITGNIILGDASQNVETADGFMSITTRNPTPLGGSTVEDTTVACVTADNMQEAENHCNGETDQADNEKKSKAVSSTRKARQNAMRRKQRKSTSHKRLSADVGQRRSTEQ